MTREMIAFMEDHSKALGVEAIGLVLPITPSTDHEHVAQQRDQLRPSARAQRHQAFKPDGARVLGESFAVYGIRKMLRQTMRENTPCSY